MGPRGSSMGPAGSSMHEGRPRGPPRDHAPLKQKPEGQTPSADVTEQSDPLTRFKQALLSRFTDTPKLSRHLIEEEQPSYWDFFQIYYYFVADGNDASTQTDEAVSDGAMMDSMMMLTEPMTPYTEEDWRAAVHHVQDVCKADFSATCGDDIGKPPKHGKPPMHGPSGHGPEGMMGHGGMHHHGRRRMQGEELALPGGPLGFGSAIADKCLLDHADELDADCSDAIAHAQNIFVTLDPSPRPPSDAQNGDEEDSDEHHHHHGAAGFLCFLVILALCACACCIPRHHHCRMRTLLHTLEENPELKHALEEAAGTPIPLPKWHHKLHLAIEANPDLKEALRGAINDFKAKPENQQRRRRHLTLIAGLFLFVVLVFVAPGLAFAFSAGVVIALVIWGLVACCKRICCRRSPAARAVLTQPLAGVPVMVTSAPMIEKKEYVPPPLHLVAV